MKNIHHQAFEDVPDRGFRNVGRTHSDAGKYPKESTQDKNKLLPQKWSLTPSNLEFQAKHEYSMWQNDTIKIKIYTLGGNNDS
jgi:hypothetical protein